MVQTKKFEQTFINDYLAWNLHETDVERRGREEGLKEGRKDGRVAMCAELIQSGLLSVKDAALKLGMPEEELKKHL
ncbi:MAG: hypothetical protein IJR93_13410 [Treponema sp.]|nr:hypothetical protein [Treponema sp.]